MRMTTSCCEDVVEINLKYVKGDDMDSWAEEVITVVVCWLLEGGVHYNCEN